ncbi:MAG TPA: hypothetical protein VN372_03075 [Methanospirillum sp.]|nr:hypothetical protein [Methanospirillum sp.]
MKGTEGANAEMVGVILLIAVMGSGIVMVGVQLMAQVPTAAPPYVFVEIACGNFNSSFNIKDFPCRSGSIDCYHSVLNLTVCRSSCTAKGTNQYKQCLAACEQGQNCADLSTCNMAYICHNGGDPLDLNEMKIWVNQVEKPLNSLMVYNPDTNISHNVSSAFEVGEVIRLPLLNSDKPLKTVTISYNDYRSGNNQILAKKDFI